MFTLIPGAIVYLRFNTSSFIINLTVLLFYIINPMFTLYLTLYSAISFHFNREFSKIDDLTLFGADINLGWAVGAFAFQTILYSYGTYFLE